MSVLRACINLQFLEHLSAELSIRKHTFYSMSDDFFRLLCLKLFESDLAEAARISGMSLVDLFFSLLACNLNLFSVDNDYIVTTVNMRCVSRLLLSAKD